MTVWTSYQGIEVKDSQAGVPCRHPKYVYDPDKMFTLEGVSLLLLADETLIVVCDQCGFNGITGRDPYVKPEKQPEIVKQSNSLLAHVNGMHHPNRDGRVSSRYTNEQIKVAIKVWLKWKQVANKTGILNWTQSACDELEGLGFKPYTSEKWNPSQLGSLVRHYIKRPEFRNLKAGPMDDKDRAALAEMLREAQARHARPGTHIADIAQITTRGGNTKQTYAEREAQAAEFAAAIKASEAAQAARKEEAVPDPTLTFVTPGSTTPTMTLPVGTPVVVPAQRQESAPTTTVVVETPLVAAPVAESDFKLVSDDQEDGTIIFLYKGRLMGGRPVKRFEI